MLFLIAFTLLAAAAPLVAAQDEPGVKQVADGYMFDFNNQDLRVVLPALAEAGGYTVLLNDVDGDGVTLRTPNPVSKDEILGLIRGIVDGNQLIMTVEGSIIKIEESQRRRWSSTSSMPDLELFTYRLKHTSAAQLAPVLMNLVSGSGGRRNVTSPNNRRGPNNRSENQASSGRGVPPGITTLLQGAAEQGGGIMRAEVNGREVPQTDILRMLRGMESAANGGDNGGNAGAGSSAGLSLSANEIRVVAEEATNTLLIRAAADDWELIKKIIETVDLRPLQVLIEVTIVEVTRSKSLDVGIDATVTHDKNGRVQRARLPGVASARDFVAQIAGGRGAIDFTAALNALASRGELRVVSLPVIIAQNNKEAVLNVGSSRPFIQVSQTVPNDPTGRVETIQYLDVGTTLTLTPTINADGYVNLVVAQTANTATNEIQFDAPVLSKREAATQVFLRDGQTTVIGGLADNTRDRVRSGIPILSWIPIIGGLFRTTHDSDTQSELYLFLTPHIISDDADIDRLRNAVQQESDLLREVPLQQRIPPRLADTLPAPQVFPAPRVNPMPVVPSPSPSPSPSEVPVPSDTVRPSSSDTLRPTPVTPLRPTSEVAPTSRSRRGAGRPRRPSAPSDSLPAPSNESRGDETRADKTQDDIRVNDAHVDAARVDDARVDDAHVDDAHVNDTRVDDAHVDDARVDDAHVDDAHVNDAHVNDARVDDAHVDDARLDDARVDDARMDDAGMDNVRVDDAGVGQARADE